MSYYGCDCDCDCDCMAWSACWEKGEIQTGPGIAVHMYCPLLFYCQKAVGVCRANAVVILGPDYLAGASGTAI